MFEGIIQRLDELTIPYTEDYEAGTLVIDIANATKMDIIELVQIANDLDLSFTISDVEIVIQGDMPMEEAPMDTEEMPMQEMALNDMMGNM